MASKVFNIFLLCVFSISFQKKKIKKVNDVASVTIFFSPGIFVLSS